MKQKIRRTIDTILVPLGAVIFICSSIVVIASPLSLFSITHWLQVIWILLAFCISLALAVFSFKLTKNTIRKVNTQDNLLRKQRAAEAKEEEQRKLDLGFIKCLEEQSRTAQEKLFKIEMRNDLAWTFVFCPIFIGIWLTSAFVWGPLTGLAIGWLPAAIGGGLVYSIFHSEA